jgi:periplasmic protein TonB
MKKNVLLLCMLLATLPALAQHQQAETAEQLTEQIFPVVEKEAEPKGGMQAFYTFLAKNIDYPRTAVIEAIAGTVYLRFTIDETGRTSGLEVHQGAHPDLDAEALRVVQLFNEQVGWIPASTKGEAVAMQKIIPIKFKLAGGKRKKS